MVLAAQNDFKKDIDSKWSKLQGALGVLSRRIINLKDNSDLLTVVETRLNELERKQNENTPLTQTFGSNSQTSITKFENDLELLNNLVKNNTKKIDLLEKRLRNIEKHFFEILKKFQSDPANKDSSLSQPSKVVDASLITLSKTKTLGNLLTNIYNKLVLFNFYII